jgi:DNA-binding transcriptional MerR regulator
VRKNWKLQELADKSQQYLGGEGESNRVQWRPTARQIRYYTTLGLLDKPFGGRGQGATYGPKHLLQLIAIKRLQHQGLKLADIQSVLAGLSREKLTELLGYSQEWFEELGQEEMEEAELDRRQTAFWSVIPETPLRNVTVNQYCHFELAPGATLMASQTALDHLDLSQRQEMAAELLAVWQKYQQKK